VREHEGIQPAQPVGRLFLVGTPIGNPDDLSLRAIRTLRRVSLIAAEHPAVTQQLLGHHHIQATVTSYGPSGIAEKVAVLIDRLKGGQDIALVVDSGMPCLHDPGQLFVAAAHEARIPVTAIPGPSVVTASVALSGSAADQFLFAGTAPRASRSLRRFLGQFRHEPTPVVFLVGAPELSRTIRCIAEMFGARELTLVADLTKAGEVVLKGSPGSLLQQRVKVPRDAEITVVLGGTIKGPGRTARTAGRAIRRRGGG